MDDEALAAGLRYALDPEDPWVTTLTIAHLRIPRVEFMQWSDFSDRDVMNIVARMIVDKALTALIVTTYPVHDESGLGGPYVSE